MSLDPYAIRERATSRTFGWSNTSGAPAAVKQAAADYQAAVTALDDALVDYEIEVSQRETVLRKHNDAVAQALREGNMPPKAKVPSLEEIEVRHGAIIAARQGFVQEAAALAERTAQQHYPQWRAEILEQLQAAAAALTQVTIAAADAARDWGSAAQVLARLDRSWAPRTAKLDSASFLAQIDRWLQQSSIESTQLGRNIALYTDKLQQLTAEPIIAEYDPAGGMEQFSAAYLAQQSPETRETLLHLVADSMPAQPGPAPIPAVPSGDVAFLDAS